MAEGGRLQIETDAQGVGLLLPHQLLEDGEKAIDGVGGRAVPGREGPDAVKSPIEDGISVDDHKFHGEASRLRIKISSYSISVFPHMGKLKQAPPGSLRRTRRFPSQLPARSRLPSGR